MDSHWKTHDLEYTLIQQMRCEYKKKKSFSSKAGRFLKKLLIERKSKRNLSIKLLIQLHTT